MSCNECDRYRMFLSEIGDKIDNFLMGACPRRQADFATPVGKLIAATASAKGLLLTAVSVEAGFADDYVTRVCRGKLLLNARAAKLIGDVLGIDLNGYVVASVRAPRKPKSEPAAPDLPGVVVPVVPGVSLAMGGLRQDVECDRDGGFNVAVGGSQAS